MMAQVTELMRPWKGTGNPDRPGRMVPRGQQEWESLKRKTRGQDGRGGGEDTMLGSQGQSVSRGRLLLVLQKHKEGHWVVSECSWRPL